MLDNQAFLAAISALSFQNDIGPMFFDGFDHAMGSSRPPGFLAGQSYAVSGRDSCCHIHWCNDNSGGYCWEPWLNYTGFGIQVGLDLILNDEIKHSWEPQFMLGEHIETGEDLHRMMRNLTVRLMQNIDDVNNHFSVCGNQNATDDYANALMQIQFERGVARSCFIGPSRSMSTNAELAGIPLASITPNWWNLTKWCNDNSPYLWELWNNFESTGVRVGLDAYDADGNLIQTWPAIFITMQSISTGQKIFEAGTQCLFNLATIIDNLNKQS